VDIQAYKNGAIVCHADLRTGNRPMSADHSRSCGSGVTLTREIGLAEVSASPGGGTRHQYQRFEAIK
jgi:hypothetical protein